MFLNSYLNTNAENKELIDGIYSKIVTISRNKTFYEYYSVPDTIDGRFDLLVLFSVIITFFLHQTGNKGKLLSQMLFDRIFLDLDLSLRELGAGDAGVNMKIKNMVKSYMGRQKVYCNSLEKNDFKSFKMHIINNIYRNVDNYSNSPDLLNSYCKKICTLFQKTKDDDFLRNIFKFPNI
jgi:cytochrome b pre-mRNA-processing protein 3